MSGGDKPSSLVQQDADAAELVRWLAEREAKCPLCGYNLRALTEPRCPECGNALRLSVSLADPYLKGWVGILTALFLPAGVGVLWCALILKDGPPRGSDSGLLPPMILQIASIPLAVWVSFTRRRIQMWQRETQATFAVAAWIACVAEFAWVMATVH